MWGAPTTRKEIVRQVVKRESVERERGWRCATIVLTWYWCGIVRFSFAGLVCLVAEWRRGISAVATRVEVLVWVSSVWERWSADGDWRRRV